MTNGRIPHTPRTSSTHEWYAWWFEHFWCFGWEREMFYLTTHSTHFIYGVRHMVKDHSDSEKGNPLPPHRLLLSIDSNGYFYMHHPTYRITHTTAFVTPVVEHWLEREIAQWVQPMKDRSDDPPHHERTLYLWATSRSVLVESCDYRPSNKTWKMWTQPMHITRKFMSSL